jgi:hypothetical protein
MEVPFIAGLTLVYFTGIAILIAIDCLPEG